MDGSPWWSTPWEPCFDGLVDEVGDLVMKAICILGPTAVGKSDLAVEAARRFKGEIVNADSMQVFRSLDVGTGMPPPELFDTVPHHLYRILDADQEPDAADWARQAATTMEEIHHRLHVPFVVGGTFFWVRALFDGFSAIPPILESVRGKLAESHAASSTGALYARLGKVDPVTARRLKGGDTQRILRALEVYEATGTPLSVFQERPARPAVQARVLKLALSLPREELFSRINERVDGMVKSGLVEEVRDLLATGCPDSVRPLRSASYLPVIRHLAGEVDLEGMKNDVAMSHRRYAKRQLTWLRREPDAVTVARHDEDKAYQLIADFLGG